MHLVRRLQHQGCRECTNLPSTAAGAYDLAAAGGEGKTLRMGGAGAPKDAGFTHSRATRSTISNIAGSLCLIDARGAGNAHLNFLRASQLSPHLSRAIEKKCANLIVS